MKTKNKLLAVLSTVCVACAALAFTIPSVVGRAADDVGTEETTYGFYMEDGAAVRIRMGDSLEASEKCAGIRFTTYITEDYYTDTLETTYTDATSFVLTTEVAPAVGTFSPQVYTWDISDGITCVDGVSTFYAALDYSDLTETQLTQALALELKATSYITVTKADETTVKVETETSGQEDTVRCMRAVAVAALRDTKTSAADKLALQQYLGNDETGENEETVYIETSEEKAFEGDYSAAYREARKIAQTSLGGAEIDGLELGEKGELVLFDNENNYKIVPFQYVTKAIEVAEDLKVFTLATTNTFVDTESKTIKGYYVLTGNLGATAQTAEHHTLLNASGSMYNAATTAGFAGTFDGNGYTLSANVDSYGLFGALADNAVIKNVVLDLYAKGVSNYTRCATLLAVRSNLTSANTPALIENVYVKMNDNREEAKKTFNVSLFRYGNNDDITWTKMKNLVIENVNCEYAKDTDEVYYTKAGGVMFIEDAKSYAGAFNTNTANCYVIAQNGTPLSITAKSGSTQKSYTAQYPYSSSQTCFKNFSYISTLSEATNLAWTYDETSGRLTVK